MRRSWALALLAPGLAGGLLLGGRGVGGPAAVHAQPRLTSPLNVTADDVTVDNTGRTLVAHGHVRLTYEKGRATSDLLRLDRSARTAVLSGHVQVTDPQGRAQGDTVTASFTPDIQLARVEARGNAELETAGYTLSAQEIVLDLRSDRVDARGNVGVETSTYSVTADQITTDRRSDLLQARGHLTMFSPPDLVVTGERAAYDRHAQYALVSGHPVVESKEGRVSGDWMELFRAANRAVVHGPARAEVYGATITGEDATVDLTQAAAVFAGNVVITRRQGTVWADQATILYDARRIIAEGTPTHATFTDVGEITPP